MKKINEMDYLYASGRIRVLEGFLLNKERADRMIEGKTTEGAFRVLADCGYDASSQMTANELEQLLSDARNRLFNTMDEMIPDRRIVDVFRVRYDIHNIKVFLKTPMLSKETNAVLLDCGRVSLDRLASHMREMGLHGLPAQMQHTIEEAQDILVRTGDPQMMDIALDNACLKDMLELAQGTLHPFLVGYVRLIIDSANLKTFVRLKRLNKDRVLLRHALAHGGNIPPEHLTSDISGSDFENLYRATILKDAAISGANVLRETTPIRELDLACDNAIIAYLKPAKMIAFGIPIAVAYLAAKEYEITAIRTILTGLLSGLSPDHIKERMRDHYV